jgi:hypothetical protein
MKQDKIDKIMKAVIENTAVSHIHYIKTLLKTEIRIERNGEIENKQIGFGGEINEKR